MKMPTRRRSERRHAMLEPLEDRIAPATFIVLNANDQGPGSLRQAILDANSANGVDTIAFAISAGTGVRTIQLLTELPVITDGLNIDGYSQPGASVNSLGLGSNAVLQIELDGSSIPDGPGSESGLTFNGTGALSVKGLIINRFHGYGVEVLGGSGSSIVGNWIGPASNGGAVANNQFGIYLNNTTGTLIGGTTPADRNVISNNSGNGIEISNTGSATTIQGNYIGTNPAGTAALPNGFDGVYTQGPNTQIGGIAAGAGNVISASASSVGVLINLASAAGSRVEGNFIGTDATGSLDFGNADIGVSVVNTPNVIIGGANPAARNVISGNGFAGVTIEGPGSTNALVQGNLIGTDPSGTIPIGNDVGGVLVFAASGARIGGINAGEGNVIAFNTGDGVQVDAGGATATGNSIRGNSIFGNTGLGINLLAAGDPTSGVTLNDALDADGGANGLQNFPVLTSATRSGSTQNISGSLHSTPGTTFSIDFYASPIGDASGYGEGLFFLGNIGASTDASGNVAFNFSPATGPIPPNSFITAVATDGAGNSSEFSAALPTQTVFVWDGGSGSSDWNDPINWDLDMGTPGAVDTAVLSINSTIDLGTTPHLVGSFQQSAGTLTGAATLTVAKSLVWTGGAQTGSGTTRIDPSATATLSGPTDRQLTGRTLDNAGALDWSGTGQLVLSSATITNSGTFNLLGDQTMAVGGSATINNLAGATFAKTGGSGTSLISLGITVNNAGLFRSASGTLDVGNGFTQTGGATELAGGNVRGAGTLTFQGGELRGAGTITGSVSNTGATVRPSGTGAAGTLAITGSYSQGASGVLAVELGGTGAGQFDVLSIGGGATLGGTLNVATISGFTPTGGNSFRVVQSTGNPGTFPSLTGTPGLSQSADASGLALTSGSISFIWDNSAGNGDWFNPLNWNLDSGVPGATDTAILNIASTINLTGDTSVGTFQMGAGTFTGPNTLTIVNGFDWTGGTLGSGGGFTLAAGSVSTMSGAAAKTSARTMTIGGSLTWTGTGNFEHTNNTITIASGGLCDIQTDADYGDNNGNTAPAATLSVAGTLRKSAGTGVTDFGGNLGTGTGSVSVGVVAGGAVEGQSGTLHFRGGFTNAGTVTAGPGTLNFTSFTQTAGSTVLANGALGGGITFAFNGGTLAGVGTITGNVTASGGGIFPGGAGVAGTLSITGNFTPNSATTLNMDIGGTTPGTYDVLSVGGTAQLSGVILNSTLIGGFNPTAFNVYPILTAASVLGSFNNAGGALPTNFRFGTTATTGAVAGPLDPRIVTTTADLDDPFDGQTSLREAISIVQKLSTGSRIVSFNIPGAGPHVITPTTPLPFILDRLVIDGYSQPGASANTLAVGNNAVLKIQLSGSVAGGTGLWFFFNATNSSVRGLSITGFTTGVQAGNADLGGGGISFQATGNWIGVAPDGTAAGNDTGIFVSSTATFTTIGGATPAERNVISANTTRGIAFGRGSAISGNYIGTNPSGTAAMPNGEGILVAATNVFVLNNVISGNTGSGVVANSVSGLTMRGNLIGTSADGTADLGNGTGLSLNSISNANIGSATPADRNVISGNGTGLLLTGGTNINIRGNLIGTNLAGTGSLGNDAAGISLSDSTSVTIGGTAAGEPNTIAFNGGAGVSISGATATGNRVRGNSIHSNTGLGIDLGGDGLTANDADDSDTGPNGLQNFPLVTSVVRDLTTATISGNFQGAPGSTFTLDFYASPTADPSGFGEGQVYLGSITTSTDGSGTGTYSFNSVLLPPPGNFITATATNSANETSEFGPATAVASVFTWDNSAGTNDWANPLNWDLDTGVPGPLDVAILNINSTIDLGSTPRTVASFQQSAGTLTGAGSLTVLGALEWSGGTMSGTGITIIPAGATWNLTSNTGNMFLNGRTVNLGGTANFTGTGLAFLENGSTINNSGTFLIATDGDLGTGLGTSAFNNLAGAIFRKTGGTGDTDIGSASGAAAIDFTNAGTVEVLAGRFFFNDAFTQTAGATLLNGGAVATGSTMAFSGGELRGVGTITGNVNNTGATVRPGGTGAAGTLAITGGYTQGAGGTLAVELGGTAAGQFDVLNVGAATVDGALDVANLAGFTPAVGNSFRILQSTGNPTTFSTLTGTTLGLSQSADATGVVLTAGALTFIWDNSTGNSDWFNPLNWDRDSGVPGSADTAVLSIASTINLGASTSVGFFTQTNGTLQTGSTLTVLGGFSWSGGAQTGGGTTELAAGATSTISGGALKSLGNHVLNNSGTLTWSGAGNIEILNGALNNLAGGIFDIQTDSDITDPDGNGNAGSLSNAGTWQKTSGTGTTSFFNANGNFTNTGIVDARSGTLQFDFGAVSNAGTWNTATGAVVRFNSTPALNTGSSFTGTGVVRLANGASVSGALSSTTLELAGGTWNGTASVSGLMKWTGGTLSNGGVLSIPAASMLAIASTADVTIGNHTLANSGTVVWSGSGNIVILNGVIDNKLGGVFDIQTDADIVDPDGNGNAGSITNAGTWKKSAGVGLTTFFNANGAFTNTGTVDAQSGSLRFDFGVSSNGTWNAGSGSVVQFNGGVTLNAGTVFTGAGVNRITTNVALAGNSTTTNLDFASGSLTGTGTISGDWAISGGVTINGNPTHTGGTLAITSAADITLASGSLSNSGTINWTGSGNFVVLNGGISNLAGGLFDIQTGADFTDPDGNGNTGTFTNAGTWRKSAGVLTTMSTANGSFTNSATGLVEVTGGALQISYPFNNSGVADAKANLLQFGGGGSSNGNFTAASGGMVEFIGSTQTLLTGAALGGSGIHRVSAGTLAVTSGASNSATNFEITGGSFSGPGELTVTQSFGWTAGSLTSGAVLSLAGGSTSTISSAALKSISNGTVNNSGSLTWTGAGNIEILNGSINNLAGGVFEIQTDADIVDPDGNSNAGSLSNAGVWRKTVATGVTSFFNANGGFTNIGTVDAQSGTLQFDFGTTSNAGIWNATSTGLVLFNTTPALNTGTSFTGPGVVRLANGATTSGSLSSTNLELAGGTWTGTSTISGAMKWTGGTLGGGTLTIAGPSTLTIANPGDVTFGNHTLVNDGTVTWTGAGNIVTLNGAINNRGGAAFNIQTDADIVDPDGNGNAFSITNDGTWRKLGSAGLTTISNANGSFTNTGMVDVQSGTLRFDYGVSSSGTWTAASGAVAQLNGGATLNAGTVFNGAGVNRMSNSFTLGGSVTATNLEFTAGTVFGSGTISGDWSIPSPVTFNASLTHAGGTLTISSAADLTFNAGTLANTATIKWTGAGNLVALNGTIDNQSGGVFDLQTDADIVDPDGNGNAFSITNAGTWKKSAGAGESSFSNSNGSFLNDGTVLVESGTLSFYSGYTQNFGATTLAGGQLAGNTFDFGGGVLDGTGTITGAVSNGAGDVNPGGVGAVGTITIAGSYTQGSDAYLNIELGGANPGEFDVLAVTGTVSLDGQLAGSTLVGFTPASGSLFNVLTYASVSGDFFARNLAPSLASAKLSTSYVLAGPVAPLVVNTTADVVDGSDIFTSFREAILFANSNSGPDTITFAISGTGAQTFALTSALPTITDTLVIAGYTQPGSAFNEVPTGTDANVTIVIDGTNAGLGANGLTLGAGSSGSTIDGVALQGFHKDSSGGEGFGVKILSSNNFVTGSVIGGAGTLANEGGGLFVTGTGNTIGGSLRADRNLISGNSGPGILLNAASQTHIENNLIGTDAAGAAALANASGIELATSSTQSVITGNVISGNIGAGVSIQANGGSQNTLTKNLIGTNAANTGALPNATGVRIGNDAINNTIGGLAVGDGNTIAFNTGNGVQVEGAGTLGIDILGNTIHGNGGLGIDLGNDGTTANDATDSDIGPNNFINFPVLTGASVGGSSTTVDGSLTTDVNGTVRVEFFLASTGAFLGAKSVTSIAGTPVTFSATLSGVSAGDQIVATTTDSSLAGTSEFSAPVTAISPAFISIGDAAIVEDIDKGAQLVFTVSLDQATTSVVTVNFTTADFSIDARSATAGVDYTAKAGVVTFNPGELTTTIRISVRSDILSEFVERLTVVLSNPTSASIADGEGVGAIIDDDHHTFAVGEGSGSRFSIFTGTTDGATLVQTIQAFDPGYKGGVRVAVGDVTGDGVDDFIAGAGIGGRAKVRVFDGSTFEPVAGVLGDLSAFGKGYRGGVFVAAGDVNGDGYADVIVSTSAGSLNQVRVFSGADGSLISSFRAFGKGSGGVRVAAGDVDGDGYADIITGSGIGSSVRVFDAREGVVLTGSGHEFRAFSKSYRGGVYVAAGDLNADGIADIIVGAGASTPHVRGYLSGTSVSPQTFDAYTGSTLRGVRVSTLDLNADGIADIITTKGRRGDSTLKAFDGGTADALFDMRPFTTQIDGLYVG